MSLIGNTLTFIFIIVIAGFCILNAQDIEIEWSPVHDPVTLPLYAIALGALGSGFILGAATLWFNSHNTRKTKRQQTKHIKNLEKELAKATPQTFNQKPPSDFFPALPAKKTP